MKIKRIGGYSLLELTIIIGIGIIMITITKPYIAKFIESLKVIQGKFDTQMIDDLAKLAN
jgi:hypothetical protein